MSLPQVVATKPIGSSFIRKFPGGTLLGPAECKTFGYMPTNSSVSVTTTKTSDIGSDVPKEPPGKWEALEQDVEKVIYRCRFLTLFGVLGSLVGSVLCFVKGCTSVVASYKDYFVNHCGKAMLMLIEATDVYLLGTVMLVFGMGLYELFVGTFDSARSPHNRSSLFGLFPMKERPKWLETKSLDELKTKLGHVIVMVLLVGLLEKSRRVEIQSTGDLLCLSASVLLSSGCLYLLSKLT